MQSRLLATTGVLAIAGAGFSFVNGDFETGNFAPWVITNTTNGQTLSQQIVMFDIDGPGPLSASLAARFQVGQVTFQSGVPAGIELTQSIALIAGLEYTFDMDWAAMRETTTTGNAQGGIFELIVDGTVLATGMAGSTSSTTPKYGHLTGVYTPALSQNYNVGVRITRPFTVPADLYQLVDNFQMSVVPEPGTLLVLGAGLALLAKRRRKS
jgi:hypothetical protein